MGKIALVTGAEGFIGSHLVQFLHARGWDVIGSHLDQGAAKFPKLSNLRMVQCDLRNGQKVTQVVVQYQPTHIFHLGAQSLPTASWADPVNTFEANIMGSLHLFEAVRYMRRKPVVVSACSSAEYGHVADSDMPVKEEHPLRPLHPYGISKVCLDLLAREYFLL
jgi:GDP-4-dehydro-6-deoxy-D-mannose reductase